jgi:hypothetical protein
MRRPLGVPAHNVVLCMTCRRESCTTCDQCHWCGASEGLGVCKGEPSAAERAQIERAVRAEGSPLGALGPTESSHIPTCLFCGNAGRIQLATAAGVATYVDCNCEALPF